MTNALKCADLKIGDEVTVRVNGLRLVRGVITGFGKDDSEFFVRLKEGDRKFTFEDLVCKG